MPVKYHVVPVFTDEHRKKFADPVGATVRAKFGRRSNRPTLHDIREDFSRLLTDLSEDAHKKVSTAGFIEIDDETKVKQYRISGGYASIVCLIDEVSQLVVVQAFEEKPNWDTMLVAHIG